MNSSARNFCLKALSGTFFLLSNTYAGDLVWSDDFEPGPSCAGVSTPGVDVVTSPESYATILGTQSRFVIKVRSCGYTGSVALSISGSPASWTTVFDSQSLTLTNNASAVSAIEIDIPTDGESGSVPLDIAATASNTAHATATLDVANQIIIPIADGTGSGDHHFPAFTYIKLGTMVRFVDQDSVTAHRIHGDGGIPHQPNDMFQGQEYDVTPNSTGDFYCHDHTPTPPEKYQVILD